MIEERAEVTLNGGADEARLQWLTGKTIPNAPGDEGSQIPYQNLNLFLLGK